MLILTRKLGESIIIGDDIKITIEKINKSQVKFRSYMVGYGKVLFVETTWIS